MSMVKMLENGEQFLELNDVQHWIRVSGAEHQTTPLVIIHGGPGGTVFTFEQTAGIHLELFQTIIYFEQRGCGRSSAALDPNTYTIPCLIKDIEALCEALQLNQIDLLGFSFGAELALEYAFTYPQRVRKIVAQAPASIFGAKVAAVQLHGFEIITDLALRNQIRDIKLENPNDNDALGYLWSIVDIFSVDKFLFQNQAAAQRNRATWEEFETQHKPSREMARAFAQRTQNPNRAFEILPRVYAPTLVLSGLHDRNGGVDLNRDVAQLLPNATFKIFYQSAHFPEMEETKLYIETIREFLEA
jgi:proline iminopeptidase